MNQMEAIFAFAGLAVVTSVLCTSSFVAMVIAKAVQRRPDLVEIDSNMLDIAAKVSRFTFFVSAFLAALVYMAGGIGLVFGIPAWMIWALTSQF